ncbi:MAG: cupin domain-containing protein [Aureispira sp.]|nr:cupin domain-containing protein [Aureispira sp.]
MRYCVLLLLLIFSVNTQAQVDIKKFGDVVADEEYENVKVMPIHSDRNTSVFVIFVKKEVKKHFHQYHTEVVTVLEGKGEMFMNGKVFDVKVGDCIVIPPGTEHAVITRSGKPLKVLSVQSPEFEGEDRIYTEDEDEEEEDED